jgi:hypothetical protein
VKGIRRYRKTAKIKIKKNPGTNTPDIEKDSSDIF